MKSLLGLMQCVLKDMGTLCGVTTDLDYKYIKVRTEHEGLTFLSVRLASFAKDLEKALSKGFVADDAFYGFRRRAGLPELLRGFLQQVFSPDGMLLPDPNPDCIYAVRQVALLCEKVRVDYSEDIVQRAINGYLESERNVKLLDRRLSAGELDDSLSSLRKIFILLWGDVLSSTERALLSQEGLVPRHGPGKTADRLVGNQKWMQSTWPVRLDEWFPHQEYLVPNLRYWREATEHVTFLSHTEEQPVKVVTVPKTVGKARIIAMEPTAMQYCQQALDRELRRNLDKFRLGFVSLRDQRPNQDAALKGSLSGELATLDLSAASDSLSNQLVIELLSPWRHLSGAVQACRSYRADVQGEVIHLSKFASMGSALCFPLETMVFVALAVAGTLMDMKHSNLRTITRREVETLQGQVRAYGDDIIVPSAHAPRVIEWLEAFGFKVNSEKSFWTGRFRESCGKEYYDGIDVSIVRVRELLSASPRSGSEVISTVSLRNQAYWSGMWHTARWLDDFLSSGLHHYPVVMNTSGTLGRHSVLGYETQRIDQFLQSPMVRGYAVKAQLPSNPLNEVWALMKVLCVEQSEIEEVFDFLDSVRLTPDHLILSGRLPTVTLKLAWRSPL
jgi:hypothetical protein